MFSVDAEIVTDSVVDEYGDDDITKADDVDEKMAEDSDPAVTAIATWCRAALWRFRSFWAGPRCRGRRGRGEGGGKGAVEGGRECGAPG